MHVSIERKGTEGARPASPSSLVLHLLKEHVHNANSSPSAFLMHQHKAPAAISLPDQRLAAPASHRPTHLLIKELNTWYAQGAGELPGEGNKLGGWGKHSSLAPTFFLGASEVNWGFSISLTLQGVIPSMQHLLCEQPHPGSLTPSQRQQC